VVVGGAEVVGNTSVEGGGVSVVAVDLGTGDDEGVPQPATVTVTASRSRAGIPLTTRTSPRYCWSESALGVAANSFGLEARCDSRPLPQYAGSATHSCNPQPGGAPGPEMPISQRVGTHPFLRVASVLHVVAPLLVRTSGPDHPPPG